MAIDDKTKITINLPKEILAQLEDLAKKEYHTVSQQVSIIILNYFKDYNKILEVINETDFGVITEENLRIFLKQETNQKNYKYEEIKHFCFDELFQFWLDNFIEKK